MLTRVPAENSLLGAAYRQSTVQERVCHVDLDVCECDDDVGWWYCDFIRVSWIHVDVMRVRTDSLPYIVEQNTIMWRFTLLQ